MNAVTSFCMCVLLATSASACRRTTPEEIPMNKQGGDEVDRSKHPGTITFIKKFDGSSETKPIAEFSDSFIFVKGVPVVKEELYTWDAAGKPCSPEQMVKGKILRYGPKGEELATVMTNRPRGR
jgi:hypothetical protein